MGAWGLALAAGALFGADPSWAATMWHVEGGLSSCSNTGPGTSSEPLCTIGAGAQRAVAGDTVQVGPALYREQVNPPVSGSAASPVVFRATGPGAAILGTTNLSDPAGWSATATTAWSRPYAPADGPDQVFLDGARLLPAPGPTQTTPGSFYYDAVARVLYVDVGGGNPAVGHTVEAGARLYGFNVSGRSGIVIEGFEVRGQNHTGVRVRNSGDVVVRGLNVSYTGVYGVHFDTATNAVLEESEVSYAASNGIRLLLSTGVTVLGNATHHNAFHGIALQESSGNTLAHNRAYANLRPEIRSANGISLKDFSSDNLLYGNQTYGNDDTGMQIYTGSDRNLVVRNLSWANGDHGFDTVGAAGTRYISNTSFGNFNDGFSVEGNAVDTWMANNIAVDNGLTTGEYDLFVRDDSVAGFRSDHDLFWNSAPGIAVNYNDVLYPTLQDFALATDHETNGVGADPLFVDPAGGDFHLRRGSPAIDSADAGDAGFVAMDPEGRLPFDVPMAPDLGAGAPAYADRGVLEFAECDPADGGEPVPGLTTDLVFTASPALTWTPATNALFHNTYRGTITGPMGARAAVFDHVCFESADAQGNGDLVTEDAEIPPAGTAFYYLTSGDGCSEGPLDSDAAHAIPNPEPCL